MIESEGMMKKRSVKYLRWLSALLLVGFVLPLVINMVVKAASFDSKTALRFDGHNDMVLVADDGTFDFADAFTVEAWVKPYALGSDSSFKGIIGGAEYERSSGLKRPGYGVDKLSGSIACDNISR